MSSSNLEPIPLTPTTFPSGLLLGARNGNGNGNGNGNYSSSSNFNCNYNADGNDDKENHMNSNSSTSASASASASANGRVLLDAKPFYTQRVAMTATIPSQSCINTEGAPPIPSLTMEDETGQSSSSSSSSNSISSSQNSQRSFCSANGFGIGVDIGIRMSSPPKLSRRKRRRSDLNRRGSITLSNKEIKSSPDLWVPDLMNLSGSGSDSSSSNSSNNDDDHSCDYRIELTLSSKRRSRNKYDDFLNRFDRISV